MHRSADYPTAQEIFVAVEMAKLGAAAIVIERLTGFGARWARGIVREHGGALALKWKDPVRWFEASPERLLHAAYVQCAYDMQSTAQTVGRRLLAAYRTYRNATSEPGLLDINACAQIIDLYQSGNAWVRECIECGLKHLVLSERTLCPLCRIEGREFCRRCATLLPENHPPLRAYCDACTPRAVRMAFYRRTHREQAAGTVIPAQTAFLIENSSATAASLNH